MVDARYVLFNNTHCTFSLRLYGVGHLIKDKSVNERIIEITDNGEYHYILFIYLLPFTIHIIICKTFCTAIYTVYYLIHFNLYTFNFFTFCVNTICLTPNSRFSFVLGYR